VAAFGNWKYTVDRQATELAYSKAKAGGAADCACSYCRNFIVVRDKTFPWEFLELLKQLGIDPTKDGEVYHEGAESSGSHFYGGWYHFVGTLDVDGDCAPVEYPGGFISYMCVKSAPCLTSLEPFPLVQLEFRARGVPWAISEEEPL
jgi:hypothetical protein